jgi:hypothetical protein
VDRVYTFFFVIGYVLLIENQVRPITSGFLTPITPCPDNKLEVPREFDESGQGKSRLKTIRIKLGLSQESFVNILRFKV